MLIVLMLVGGFGLGLVCCGLGGCLLVGMLCIFIDWFLFFITFGGGLVCWLVCLVFIGCGMVGLGAWGWFCVLFGGGFCGFGWFVMIGWVWFVVLDGCLFSVV